MPELRHTLRLPFDQQIAAFRLRLGSLVPTVKWDDIEGQAHDRAFMVAGATKAELLADLGAAVDKAIADGTGLEAFRRDFRDTVASRGWHGWTGEGTRAGEAWRTRVIYRTNMATTYAAGRMAQLVEGNFKFWVYRHGAALEPRLHHLALDGLVLPPDHPFWRTHAPPNGWGCTCYVLGARSEAGARRLGGDPDKALPEGWDRIDPRTGAPKGIDKGWNHAPGTTVARLIPPIAEKIARLPAPTGADLVAGWPERIFAAWSEAFAAFVDRALSSLVEQNYMIVGALKPQWIDAAARRGVGVQSAEIAVTDRDIQHAFRGTAHVTVPSTRTVTSRAPKVMPLDLDWYKRLPEHLRAPEAVLLDRTGRQPVFLLIYDIPGTPLKLAVALDVWVKKAGAVMNTLTSGRVISAVDLTTTLGRGVELIEGSV